MYNTIKQKGYARLNQKKLVPTENGTTLCGFVTAHFPDVFDPAYTAHLEAHLDEIAAGRSTRLEVLRTFWSNFQPNLTKSTESTLAHIANRVSKPLLLHPAED